MRKRILPKPLQGVPAPSAILDWVSHFGKRDLFTVLFYVGLYSKDTDFRVRWLEEDGAIKVGLYFGTRSFWAENLSRAFMQNPLVSSGEIKRRRYQTRVLLNIADFDFVPKKEFAVLHGVSESAVSKSRGFFTWACSVGLGREISFFYKQTTAYSNPV